MTIADNWSVLVVEDEYDSIQMVSKILRHHGAQVEIARTGHECLEKLEAFTPTFIIMDLMLPEMDGWETLAQIRANDHTAHLKVFAITAYHSVNVEEDAHQAGFDAYFPKPLNTNRIVEKLASLII
ncbi:MAG: response regulator [Chloroflexota bacterium]